MKTICICAIAAVLLLAGACKKKNKGFLTLVDLTTITKADYIGRNKILIDKGYEIYNYDGMQYMKYVGRAGSNQVFVSFPSDTNFLMTYCTNDAAISSLYEELKAPGVEKISEQTFRYQALYFTAFRSNVGNDACNCITVHSKLPQ